MRRNTQIGIAVLIALVIISLLITLVALPLTCVYDLYGLDKCKTPVCDNGTVQGGKCICNTGYGGNPCKKSEGEINIDSGSSDDDSGVIGDTESQLRLKDMKYAYDSKPDAFRIVAAWWVVYNQSDPIYSWWISTKYLDMVDKNTETEIANEMESIMDYYIRKKFNSVPSGTFYQKYLKLINAKPSVWMDIISVSNLITTDDAYKQLKWTFTTFRVNNEGLTVSVDYSQDNPKFSTWDYATIYRNSNEEAYIWMNRVFRKVIGGRPGYSVWPEYQPTPYGNDSGWKSFFADESWKATVGAKTRLDTAIITKMESYLSSLCAKYDWVDLRTRATDLYSCTTGKLKKLPGFVYTS
jgi:hypothetical protein